MRNMLMLSLKLMVITLIAGLALGATYAFTKEPIRQQNLAKAEQARRSIFNDAEFRDAEDDMKAILEGNDQYATITGAYYAVSGDQVIGCVVAITGSGYGGDIELTVGIDTQGNVVGLEVGGNNETPGLGAKAKEKAFAGQFAGKQSPLTVTKSKQAASNEISAITGATITSRGVTEAVNKAAEFAAQLLASGGK